MRAGAGDDASTNDPVKVRCPWKSIYSLLEGAERATGSVAAIDVFRAFTTAAGALANGASSIIMVRSVDEALTLREVGVGQICRGLVVLKAHLLL